MWRLVILGQAPPPRSYQVGQNNTSGFKLKMKWRSQLFWHQNGMIHFYFRFQRRSTPTSCQTSCASQLLDLGGDQR